MTLAGKIFTILTMLLAIVFLVFTTPVAKTLIELQQDVKAIEFGGADSLGVTHRSHVEIQEKAATLDAQRVELQYQLNRIKQNVSAESSRFKNQIDSLQGQLTLWNDMEKAWRQSVIHWQESLRDLNAEIEARTAEKTRLEQELAEFEQQRVARNEEVTSLQAQLDEADAKLAQTLQVMLENYQKLQKLADAAQSKSDDESDGVAASSQ